jgi:hypothetical protein
MRKVFAITFVAVALLVTAARGGLAAVSAAPRTYAGINVTYQGTKAPTAFLTATPEAGDEVHVDVWELDHGKTMRSYDIDMTKLQHMIVVSDDLSDFQHIHPALHQDGHFTIDVHAKKQGVYHIYIDGMPHAIGRTVFRFDVPIGSNAVATMRQLHSPGNSQRAGPYTVTLDTTAVPFGEIATISVKITKNGNEATDLHPYLGMMSHGVFIGTKDLAYMHGHGMSNQMLDMAGDDCGDSMMQSMPPLPANATIGGQFSLDILAPNPEVYDFWLQFIGGNTVYTVPFLIRAR